MDILAFESHAKAHDPLHTFVPTPMQQSFITSICGTSCYNNYFFGSNRSGKSLAAVYAVCKLLRQGLPKSELVAAGLSLETFVPVHAWVIGLTESFIKDTIQPMYFDNGTGLRDILPFIPKEEIEFFNKSEQFLKLRNGSTATFKAAASDMQKFQGAAKDILHFDEECPFEIWKEASIRVGGNRRLRTVVSATLLPPPGMIGGLSWMFEKIIQPIQGGRQDLGRIFTDTIYNNPFIPPEEIARLESMYPLDSAERKIRLEGELIAGIGGQRAYGNFSRHLHIKALCPSDAPATHSEYWNKRLPLLWCMDFNWRPLISYIGQYDGRVFRIFEELMLESGSITDLAKEFKRAYPSHSHEVWIYGDASGQQHSHQTGKTTYQLLADELRNYPTAVKFKVPRKNPWIGDRVNAVNRALLDSTGFLGIEIDPLCTELIKDLEQVLRDTKGGIKKTDNRSDPYYYRTHASDGFGYMVNYEQPISSTPLSARNEPGSRGASSNRLFHSKPPSYKSRYASF